MKFRIGDLVKLKEVVIKNEHFKPGFGNMWRYAHPDEEPIGLVVKAIDYGFLGTEIWVHWMDSGKTEYKKANDLVLYLRA